MDFSRPSSCSLSLSSSAFRISSRSSILLFLYSAVLTLLASPCALSQNAKPVQVTSDATKTLLDAGKQSFPLTTTTNVSGNVSVQASLIPPKISSKVFGKSVGNNYAVIEVIISNRSSEASLVVHSIFIDYHLWLLSGYAPVFSTPDCSQEGTGASSAPGDDGNPLVSSQSQTCPNQIASIESRVVRGQLLDEQPWTNRNWIIRALQAAGSVATAYSFTISGLHAIQSISAFNGVVIPTAQTFWPDSTIGQMNRISDFGFQVNKVIAKQSSDIVVAFFPLDRFLTPGLKDLFISSPAIFFSPYAAALDPKTKKKFTELVDPILGAQVSQDMLRLNNLKKIANGSCAIPDSAAHSSSAALQANSAPQPAGASNPASPSTTSSASTNSGSDPNSLPTVDPCDVARILAQVSLNTVRVIVGGSMTVDVDSVPAKLDSVDFVTPDGQTPASLWTKKQTIEGVLRGSFLSGGKIDIANLDKLPISNLEVITARSSDKAIHFHLTLTDAVPAKSKLTFRVSKTTSGGVTVQSSPLDFEVPEPPPAAPATNSGAPSTPAPGAAPAAPPATPAPGSAPGGAPEKPADPKPGAPKPPATPAHP